MGKVWRKEKDTDFTLKLREPSNISGLGWGGE